MKPPPPAPPLPQVAMMPQQAMMPQTVMYQPTTQVFVNTVPSQPRQFTTGLFGCFEDFGECIYAYFCPHCHMCGLFGRAGEPCCACLFGGPVPLRTKIRTQRNIAGTICDDACIFMWCPCCAQIQLGIELKQNA